MVQLLRISSLYIVSNLIHIVTNNISEDDRLILAYVYFLDNLYVFSNIYVSLKAVWLVCFRLSIVCVRESLYKVPYLIEKYLKVAW